MKIDKVGVDIRQNTDLVDSHMRSIHPEIIKFGDFTFGEKKINK